MIHQIEIKTNKEERTRRAKRDLREKLILERALIRELDKFFDSVEVALRRNYARNQEILNATEFQPRLERILRKHNRDIRDVYDGTVINDINSDGGQNISINRDQQRVLNNLNDNFMEQHVRESARFITNTNQNEITSAVRTSIADTIDQVNNEAAEQNLTTEETDRRREELLASAVIGALAAKKFRDRAKGRTDTIALTETQTPVEKYKLNESFVAQQTLERPLQKQWNAILDTRVRPAHADADGQTQNVGDPFIVGGQKLPAPGDSSMGATIDNIANCRCTVTYTTSS